MNGHTQQVLQGVAISAAVKNDDRCTEMKVEKKFGKNWSYPFARGIILVMGGACGKRRCQSWVEKLMAPVGQLWMLFLPREVKVICKDKQASLK